MILYYIILYIAGPPSIHILIHPVVHISTHEYRLTRICCRTQEATTGRRVFDLCSVARSVRDNGRMLRHQDRGRSFGLLYITNVINEDFTTGIVSLNYG